MGLNWRPLRSRCSDTEQENPLVGSTERHAFRRVAGLGVAFKKRVAIDNAFVRGMIHAAALESLRRTALTGEHSRG